MFGGDEFGMVVMGGDMELRPLGLSEFPSRDDKVEPPFPA